METSTVANTVKAPKLDRIDLEILDCIVANLGNHVPQYPMTNHDYAVAELLDLMDDLDSKYGVEKSWLLVLDYFDNHKDAFYSIPEGLRLDLFGTANLE